MAGAVNIRFRTTEGAPVTMSVAIGHGQIASSIVTMPDRPATKHQDSFQVELGPGESLAGKQLLCSTVVTDVRPETNETSVSVTVSDGVDSVTEGDAERAEIDNGIVTYMSVVRFR